MAGVATVIMMVSFVVGFNNQVVASFTAVRHLPRAVPEVRAPLRRAGRAARGAAQPPRPHHRGRPGPEAPVQAGGGGLARSATCSAAASRCAPGARRPTARSSSAPTPTTRVANTHFVEDGRFITDADSAHAARVAVIGTRRGRRALPPPRPDRPGASPSTACAYRVIGIFEHKGGIFGGSNDNFVAIPITTFDEQFPEVKNGGGDTIHIATVPKRRRGRAGARSRRRRRSCARAAACGPTSRTTSRSSRARPSSQQFQQITGGVAAAMLVDRRHRAAGGRRGRDEHHAGQRHPAHARDRRAQGAGRHAARHRRCSSWWRR